MPPVLRPVGDFGILIRRAHPSRSDVVFGSTPGLVLVLVRTSAPLTHSLPPMLERKGSDRTPSAIFEYPRPTRASTENSMPHVGTTEV